MTLRFLKITIATKDTQNHQFKFFFQPLKIVFWKENQDHLRYFKILKNPRKLSLITKIFTHKSLLLFVLEIMKVKVSTISRFSS